MSRSNALYLCGLFWVMAQGAFGQGTGYVRVEGDRFLDENGDPFYPMVCNYFVFMPYQGTPPDIMTCRVVPGFGNAGGPNGWGAQGLDQAVKRIENDFHQLKSMGFNAIRLMAIFQMVEVDLVKQLQTTQHIFPPTWDAADDKPFDFTQPYSDDPGVEHVIDQTELVLDKAALAGLKVILVPVQGPEIFYSWDGVIKYIEVLHLFGDRFKEHPALMAYDLCNEPGYFEQFDHTKEWICEKVAAVYDELKSADPNHLITVGGVSVTEVFEWDPTILKLDFWSPHLYPIFQPRRAITYSQAVANIHSQLTWLQNNIGSAWMIGETGFVANDAENPGLMHGTEAEQASFAAAMLQMSRDAGAAGFSWWTFGDVLHFPEPPVVNATTNHPVGSEAYYNDVKLFYENNLGMLRYGDPTNCDPVTGVCDYSQLEKPIVSVFANYLDPLTGLPPPRGAALVPGPNYFNMADHPPSPYTIGGQVTTTAALPITDAVVRGGTYLMLYAEYDHNNDVIPGTEVEYYDFHTTFTDDQGDFQVVPYDYHDNPQEVDTHLDNVEHLGVTAPAAERVYVWDNVPNNETYPLEQHTFLPHRLINDITLPLGAGHEDWQAWGSIVMDNVLFEGDGSTGASADITARRSIDLLGETHLQHGSEVHIYPSETFSACEDLDGFRRPEPHEGTEIGEGMLRELERFIYLDLHPLVAEPATLLVVPNPTSGLVNVEIRHLDVLGPVQPELHLVDMLGQRVRRWTAVPRNELDITGLGSGAYSLILTRQGLHLATERLILTP